MVGIKLQSQIDWTSNLVNRKKSEFWKGKFLSPLSTNPTKWSHSNNWSARPNKFSVFDHFVGLALKGLRWAKVIYHVLSKPYYFSVFSKKGLKLVSSSLKGYGLLYSIFLKVVFHKFYLIRSWVVWLN